MKKNKPLFLTFILLLVSFVAWSTTTITVYLQDSDGSLLSGGTLRYHDGSWKSATEGAAGTFTIVTSASSVSYEMTYNNGRQTKSNVPVSATTVTFQTVTTTVALKNSSGGTEGPGTVRYHQVTWKNFGATNTSLELLPGKYTFETTFNNGRQTFSNYTVPAGNTHEVLFKTVTTTVALKDSGGTDLGTGGVVRYHQVTWANFGTSNSTKELLPGKYSFEMTFNNGRRTFSNYTVPSTDDHEVLFTTVSTTVSLKDSGGADLGGDGIVRFHQVTWKPFGASNTTKELLPGKYSFEMTYNNGRRTFSSYNVPVGSDHEVLFQTVTTTMALKDSDGTSLGLVGIGRYHQVTWKNWGTANTAKELLPGKYTFEMTYNNGRQTFSNHTVPGGVTPPPTHEVLFQTVTTTVALKDCSGTPLGTTGDVQYHQVSWASFGTSNSTKELLPGKYIFKMTYNNGRQTFSNHTVPNGSPPPATHEVLYQTATVNFTYSGPIMYHQVGWKTFTGPKELLPGKYTFKFDNLTKVLTFAACDDYLKTVVIFDLEYADGTGAPNGVGEVHNGGWKTAPGVTNNQGILIAMFDGNFTGNKKFRMKYPTSPSISPYSNEVYFNIAANSTVEFELTRVTARLWDGAAVLPAAEGGTGGNLYVHIGGWKNIGATTNGALTFDIFAKNRKFRMQDVNYSSRESYYNVPTGFYNMDFPVVRNIAMAKDQYGALVTDVDFQVWIHSGGWKSLGFDSDVGPDGMINKGILKGNWKFKMELSHSSYEAYWNSTQAIFPAVRNAVQVKDQSGGYVGSGVVATDYNSKAWVHYGGWKSLGTDSDGDGTVTCVLLSGNRKFKMELGPSAYEDYWNFNWGNPDVVFPAVRNPVEVRDAGGTLMANSEAPISKKCWVHYGGWKLLGNFDGGIWTGALLEGNRKFKAEVNYSSYEDYWHIKQDPVLAVFPVLLDPVFLGNVCGGYANGQSYVHYGGWKNLGATDANGIIQNMALLEGNRKFKMVLPNGAARENYYNLKQAVLEVVEFPAFELDILFAGLIRYYLNGWKTYTGPTLFFIDTYNFQFDGVARSVTFSGCDFEKTLAVVRLIDSNGDGLEGGIAKYNWGGWQTAGTTGPNGYAMAFIDGDPSNLNFRMYWEDSYINKYQNIDVDPLVEFQTELVTMDLISSSSAPLVGEGKVNSGGWKSLGFTPGATMELLPKSYDFRIYYNGSYINKYQNIGADPNVVFQTKGVTMELSSSVNAPLVGEGKVNSGGWKSMGNTPTAVYELLPKSYDFRIFYKGSYINKYQDIATDPIVKFQTKGVTMKLLMSDGITDTIGEGKVNSGGWLSMGNTPTAVYELLPKSYDFRIFYKGSYINKYQDISTNTVVQFQNVKATMELLASDGTTDLAGVGKVNSGTWLTLAGNTPTAYIELLPKSYDFRIFYEGSYINKYQNIGTNSLVSFQTVEVETMLVDGSDVEISGGTGMVNSGTWLTVGTTPDAKKELLPKSYNFRMYYGGTYANKYQNVGSNNTVKFVYDGGFKDSGFTPDYLTAVNRAYPNPFINQINIDFSVSDEEQVVLAVYDIRGRLIKTLMDETMVEGEHKFTWTGVDNYGTVVEQGVYVIKLITRDAVSQKTVIKSF